MIGLNSKWMVLIKVFSLIALSFVALYVIIVDPIREKLKKESEKEQSKIIK